MLAYLKKIAPRNPWHLRLVDRTKKGIYILYADIDSFKNVNDTYGHAEGDELLVDVAGILIHNYRLSDVIARIGGDEFVIIPVAFYEDSMDIISERFHSAIKLYNEKADKPYSLSISIGIAFYDPASPSSLDELLQKADRAMYRDKMEKRKLF